MIIMENVNEGVPISASEANFESSNEENTLESTNKQEQSGDAAKLESLADKNPEDLTKAEKKSLKKYQLKIDGKNEDFEIDLDNDEEVKAHLQRSKASNKRMQEAAELRKATEKFIETLRSNPRKILTDPNIGVDIKKLAQEIIEEEIANSQKSPEELEKEQLKRELQEIKDKYKNEEEERKKGEYERLQAEAEIKLDADVTQALESSSLPKTPYTVKKMAEMMMIALQNDIDLSPQDVVPLIRKQMQQDIKDMFSASSDELFEEMFKENITRVRKKRTKAAVDTANSVKATSNQPKAEVKEDGEKKLSIKDFLGI
jgi:hypothetical protein